MTHKMDYLIGQYGAGNITNYSSSVILITQLK